MSVPRFFVDVVFSTINHFLDGFFLAIGIILLIAYPVWYLIHSIFFQRTGRRPSVSSILNDFLLLTLAMILTLTLWLMPELGLFIWSRPQHFSWSSYFATWLSLSFYFSSFRLLLILSLIFALFLWNYAREQGRHRWWRSFLIGTAFLGLGWLTQAWVGVLLLTLPLFVVYYASLVDLALVVVPTARPEDSVERRRRIMAFLNYCWGTQSPMIVVDGHAWRTYSPRIPGYTGWHFADLNLPLLRRLERPGVIWTPSHQIVAISIGTEFRRVDGPGLVFTNRFERLDHVLDLRVQIRTRTIEVVSREGIRILADYLVAFRLDNQEWSPELQQQIVSANPFLDQAATLTCSDGGVGFSDRRARAMLGVIGTDVDRSNAPRMWDEWVMWVIEDQIRQVISQRNIDELWRPTQDERFANSLDEIAEEIQTRSRMTLRQAGILLVAARVIDFRFPPDPDAPAESLDRISRQRIASWVGECTFRRQEILSRAEASAIYERQRARAYAESMLMKAFVETLQRAHRQDQTLSRNVILLYFLSALQDYTSTTITEANQNQAMLLQRIQGLMTSLRHRQDGG